MIVTVDVCEFDVNTNESEFKSVPVYVSATENETAPVASDNNVVATAVALRPVTDAVTAAPDTALPN